MAKVPTIKVAPHAGAWIETYQCLDRDYIQQVAPHAGAWIETGLLYDIFTLGIVAPHAGAWIETQENIFTDGRVVGSHPMRVRGLKQR